jgi:hypothetical protein
MGVRFETSSSPHAVWRTMLGGWKHGKQRRAVMGTCMRPKGKQMGRRLLSLIHHCMLIASLFHHRF